MVALLYFTLANKLNPHMTPDLGIEPGQPSWEASLLTTALFLQPWNETKRSKTKCEKHLSEYYLFFQATNQLFTKFTYWLFNFVALETEVTHSFLYLEGDKRNVSNQLHGSLAVFLLFLI